MEEDLGVPDGLDEGNFVYDATEEVNIQLKGHSWSSHTGQLIVESEAGFEQDVV